MLRGLNWLGVDTEQALSCAVKKDYIELVVIEMLLKTNNKKMFDTIIQAYFLARRLSS